MFSFARDDGDPPCSNYYTIKDKSSVVAQTIRDISIEEMYHMTMVGNILISIGQSPKIGQEGFVPTFPGPLPWGMRPGLDVTLKKASKEHIKKVFMSIEQPASTIEGEFEDTIGDFYSEIKDALTKFSANGDITFGNLDNQVASSKTTKIGSLQDALDAIDTIILQGEGASALDPDVNPDGTGELADYYKFSEIVKGRKQKGHWPMPLCHLLN